MSVLWENLVRKGWCWENGWWLDGVEVGIICGNEDVWKRGVRIYEK